MIHPKIGDPVKLPGRNGIYTVVDVDIERGSVVVTPAGEGWCHSPRVVPNTSVTPVKADG